MDESSGPDHLSRKGAIALFLATLSFYLIFSAGHIQTIDVQQSVAVSQHLLSQGKVWITGFPLTPGGGAVTGHGGRAYAAHDIGLALIFLPVSALLNWHVISAPTAELLYTFVNPVFGAMLVTVFYRFCERLTGRAASALAAAVVLAVGTMVLPYAHLAFDAVPTAFFVLAACYFAWCGQLSRQPWAFLAGGSSAAAAVLLRLDSLIVIGALSAWVVIAGIRRGHGSVMHLVGWFAPLAAAAAVTAWYNIVRFGSWANNGHAHDPATAAGTHLLHGLAGELASPGKGLLFYSPPVVLALVGWRGLYRRDRWLALTIIGGFGVYLLYVSRLTNWSGAEAWGPRFLVPMLPLIMLPICLTFAGAARMSAVRRSLVLLVCVAGLAVQAGGATTNDVAIDRMHGGTLQQTAFDDSGIIYAWRALLNGLRGVAPYPSTVEGGIVPPPVPRFDLWWAGSAARPFPHPLEPRLCVLALFVTAVIMAGATLQAVRRVAMPRDVVDPSS
jgi:4-amino-4-deoxy-L-arabinose transferase-like glycosyltransferase